MAKLKPKKVVSNERLAKQKTTNNSAPKKFGKKKFINKSKGPAVARKDVKSPANNKERKQFTNEKDTITKKQFANGKDSFTKKQFTNEKDSSAKKQFTNSKDSFTKKKKKMKIIPEKVASESEEESSSDNSDLFKEDEDVVDDESGVNSSDEDEVDKAENDNSSDEDVVDDEAENGDSSDEDAVAGKAGNDNSSDEEEDPTNVKEGNDSDGDDDNAESHKMALERLKETDPEFYQYLQENDQKLLNFNLSDDDESAEEKDDEDEDEAVHKPTGELEVASDESDFEPEDDDGKEKDSRVITLKMLKQWQSDIHTDKSNKTIGCVIKAFHACLKRISTSDEEEEEVVYKVDGSSVFNAVIQLCVLELGPAIRKFLGLKSGSKQPPHKCKKFVKVKTLLKDYFSDLLKLLGGVTSTNILNVLLKHLHYMSSLIVSYSTITKSMIKKLVHLWGSADESVRVVAFLCILRMTHNQQQNLLDSVLRSMYMTYVKNSKFVSINSLPGINFMRRSLVEMFCLDLNVSYQHVFLYIRQLAINLRNAITTNKKENVQAVYNWQFINSLRLWGNLLQVTYNKPQLKPLLYPFVQVCLGTIKLVPTPQYYALRFHIVQVLIDLSKETGVFIPVLPFILEVLTGYDFNKKHLKVSMKPLKFTCLLRLSKSQLTENGFKDTIIDTIYGCLLEYMASQSQSIAFPDLALFCKLQVKIFTKKCNTVNYQRKLSQILEKIEQSVQFIEQERKKVTFTLQDLKQIEAWETTIKNRGTPLDTFYESWNKLREVKKRKEVTNNEALGDYNLPVLYKGKRSEKKQGDEKVVLFPSDSEDEVENAESKKRKRGKRGSKVAKKRAPIVDDDDDVDGEDIVEDLNVDDW